MFGISLRETALHELVSKRFILNIRHQRIGNKAAKPIILRVESEVAVNSRRLTRERTI